MKTRILTAAVALPLLFAAIILPWYIPETVWIFVGQYDRFLALHHCAERHAANDSLCLVQYR